jgi:hypothetical protein
MPRFPPAERPARLEELADVCVRRMEAKGLALAADGALDLAVHDALTADVATLIEGLGSLTPPERGALRARIAEMFLTRGPGGLPG